MLAVLAIVLLISRLVLDPEQFALFQGQKTHHLVLLDDSGSMQDRWGDVNAFQEAKTRLRQIVEAGARRPGTQLLTLMRSSQPDNPLYSAVPLDEPFLAEFDRRSATWTATHGSVSLMSALEAAKSALTRDPAGSRILHLLGDYRRSDWDANSELSRTIKDLIAQKIELVFVRTVPESHENVAVTDLSGHVEVAAPNVPLRLTVQVKNFGQKVRKELPITVRTDGKPLPVTVGVESLEPGQTATRTFDVQFSAAGSHEVEVLLPPDALTADNTRSMVVNLPENHPVLIVQGDLVAGDGLSILDALAPAPGITGFAPSVESVEYLRRHPLERFQSICLVNVPELAPDVVRLLEQYVQQGGGLIWFLGDQSRPAFYNDKLFRADGRGLFPARLAGVADLSTEDAPAVPDIEFSNHPLFRVFAGDENPFVETIRVLKYFRIANGDAVSPGAQVLAKLRNAAPLFLEHRLGTGRIVTCLSGCASNWTNLPQNPSFVPLMLELARYVARPMTDSRPLNVGQPIVLQLDASSYTRQLDVLRPDGTTLPISAGQSRGGPGASSSGTGDAGAAGAVKKDGAGAAAGTSPAGPAADQPLTYREEYRETDRPGVYAVTLHRVDGSDEIRRWAFNAPESESALELIGTPLLRQQLAAGPRLMILDHGEWEYPSGSDAAREAHDAVLMLLLALLAGEQLLAWRLSHHRQPARAGGRR